MSATIDDATTTVLPSRSRSLPHAIPPAGSTAQPRGADLPADESTTGLHEVSVGGKLGADHAVSDAQVTGVGTELLFHAAFLDDTERVRKASENRLRAMLVELGECAVDEATDLVKVFAKAPNDAPTRVRVYAQQLHGIAALEHQAELALQRAMRAHPLSPWIKRTVGVGEKQGARLIAAIGDPAWNAAEDRPRRGPAELWAYCGYRPGQKRQKGVRANWNAEAKMRAFLVAESCIKQMHSPYRAVYDRARVNWAERETSDLHKHNHALRCVAKAVLKDLFLEAKRVAPGQTTREAHGRPAGGDS